MCLQSVGVRAIVITSLVLVIASCGSSSKQADSAGSGENTFGLSEFAITPPTNDLRAGSVSITANNIGGEEHELVIVRADDVESLPTKPDGSVNEDAIPASAKVGEIDHIAPQSEKSQSFSLAAGHYVAFCNIIDSMMGSGTTMMPSGSPMDHGSGHGTEMGHVHFAEGMSVSFAVS
jgi:hypothetical protein